VKKKKRKEEPLEKRKKDRGPFHSLLTDAVRRGQQGISVMQVKFRRGSQQQRQTHQQA
jgi:hypothetical protein